MAFLQQFFTSEFWQQQFYNLQLTAKRFPVSLIAILLGYSLVLSEIHHWEWLSDDHMEMAALLISGLFLLFTGGTLFAERYQINTSKALGLKAGLFVLYGMRIWVEPKMDVDIAMLWIAVILTITFITQLKNRDNNPSSWFFNFQLLTALLFSFLTGLLLAGGVNLIIASIHYLFELEINNKIYGDVWSFSFMVVAPVYLLSQIPRQFDYEPADCEFPKGVNFILNYVMVPLLIIYSIILYAYFIKILLQWQLPRGNLGWMISIYGVIGILTHLGLYPVRNQNKAMISWFYRSFYPTLVIPLLLLIVAISIRIHQYGVTENRYLVMICAIWFGWLISYQFIRNKQFQLTTVTMSLSILLLASAFGPLSIKQLPLKSQIMRFETIAQSLGLLKNGTLIESQTQPELKTAKEITSAIQYILHRKKAHLLRHFFADQKAFDKALNCEKDGPCRARDAASLLKLVHIKPVFRWQSSRYQLQRISSQKACCNQLDVEKISGYDYRLPIHFYSYSNLNKPLKATIDNQELNMIVDNKGFIEINIDEHHIHFDLMAISRKFPRDFNGKVEPSDVDHLSLINQTTDLNMKLIIENITFDYASGKPKLSSITAFLLIKVIPEK